MTTVVIILTIALFLMSVSQIVFVYFLLSKKELISIEKPTHGDVNEYGESKFIDISDVSPEEGIKSLNRK